MSAPFRWEADCLADDPFAGDFGNGEVAMSDKMVTNRKGGTCHTCAGPCEPGTRNRVLTERSDERLETFRWCQCCCFAMAVYDRRPSIGDARFAMGEERRAAERRAAERLALQSPPAKVEGECLSSPDGRHQVDTSMESGPNNCFYCETSMSSGVDDILAALARPHETSEP